MYLDEYLSVLPGRAKRAVYRAVWNPDKWNRQFLVARFADGWGTGLDVGGRASEMNALCRSTEFISCNPRAPTDVLLGADRADLPFQTGSFDVVTSSDVIEHIPPDLRSGHLAELVRVARSRVIACFPLGSALHLEAEKRLAAQLVNLGVPVPAFLSEHLEFGLPTPEEVKQMASVAEESTVRLFYQGDFAEGDEMLTAAMRLRHRLDPWALGAFLTSGRLVKGQRHLLPSPEANTARVFLVIDRARARP